MTQSLSEIRCRDCGKLLVKAQVFIGEVHCRKCNKTVNVNLHSAKALTDFFFQTTMPVKEAHESLDGQKPEEAPQRG